MTRRSAPVAVATGVPASTSGLCAAPDATAEVVARLERLTRERYPEILAPSRRATLDVVVMLVDDQCRLLESGTTTRHAESIDVNETVAAQFPNANLSGFLAGGIADLTPSVPGQRGAPWLVWMMVRS